MGTDTPGQADTATSAGSDPLPEAFGLARGAAGAGLGLKLPGGLAVRVICPHFTAPSGRPIDVMVDRLAMCHTLDFRPTFDRLPFTLDVVDLLLSKLQIVEMNEKDARDLLQLLAAMPLSGGGEAEAPRPGRPASRASHAGGEMPHSGARFIDTDRFTRVVGTDWGWWRTVTANLKKLPELAAERPHLHPPEPPYDAAEACQRLLELAESAPKNVKWKVRAGVGDRVRWFELPEEVGH